MFGGWGAPVADGFSLLVAAGATFLCCVFALWSSLRRLGAARKKTAIESVWWNNRARRRSCACGESSSSMSNHFNGDMAAGEAILSAASEEKRLIGASMMEQLVPEITTHALSYLDYPSLCRLSMTNSSMRRAANDDNAWKALYHKDFTVEQDGITPVNGWKAYYAATKAVVDVNAEFFDIIRTRSLSSMSRLWLHSDYVKCIHSSGELFTGYTAVMDSWAVLLNWVQDGGGQRWAGFEIRDVRARVIGDAAWVNMKAYVDVDSDPFHVTNIFELHHGRWFIVHHHSSVMLAGHNNILG